MTKCPHTTISRYPSGAFFCDNPSCRQPFLPANGDWSAAKDEPTLEPVDVTMLDSIAGTFSAILWDYQERMLEKYGIDPKDQEPQSPEQDHECRDNRDRAGLCLVCGDNPYL